MEKPALIATDLDGTLFYDREHISDPDRQALFALHEQGVTVALATGRELPVIAPALDRLELWDAVDHIIMSGGAQIYDVRARKATAVGLLPPEVLCSVYRRYESYPISMLLPKDNLFHTNRVTEGLRHESELLGSPLVLHEDLTETFTEPNPKFIFHGTADEVDSLLEVMASDTNERVTLCRSHDNYIDCYLAGINKGAALRLLCERLDVPMAHTAAIGDNHNDLDLLRTAAVSACPGDGVEAAKQAADYVCCPAHEGAFADFCRHLGWI